MRTEASGPGVGQQECSEGCGGGGVWTTLSPGH